MTPEGTPFNEYILLPPIKHNYILKFVFKTNNQCIIGFLIVCLAIFVLVVFRLLHSHNYFLLQVKTIRDALRKVGLGAVDVETIDNVQGRKFLKATLELYNISFIHS